MRPGSMVLAYTTHQFLRQLSRRFAAILAVVAVLVVIDQAVLQPLQKNSGTQAPVVTLAARQRMLAERLTKDVLAVASGFDSREISAQRQEIQETFETLMAEHVTLLHEHRVPELNAALREQWDAMEPHYEGIAYAAAQALSTLEPTDAASGSSDLLIASAELLLGHELPVLPMMDQTLLLLKEDAKITNARLQLVEISIGASILVCIGLMGWLVFRPATKHIRQQLKDLDTNIRERTHELELALKKLRHEVRQHEAIEQKSKQLSTQLFRADHDMTIGHLTAGIAHELRQPLATMTECADACDKLLKRPSNSTAISQARDLLNNAMKAAHRITQTLRRMSNIARPRHGELESTDLHKLIHEIAELMRSELTASQTNLQLQLVASKRTIHADPIQIQQVLVNLINNSIQAIQDNNRTQRTITIRTSGGDDQPASAVACTTDGRTQNVLRVVNAADLSDRNIRLEIIDTGPGFTDSEIENAFSSFEANQGDALGVGLAICRSIVENHRGTISIATGEHPGAHIVVTLPTIDVPANAPITDNVCC